MKIEFGKHLPLPLGEVPQIIFGAERVSGKPSQSKIKDFCQLSQRESQAGIFVKLQFC